MAVDFQKIEREAPELVSLAKKAQFAVSKYNLDEVRAKVAIVLDVSGSAEHLYRSGAMQRAAEKILAVATQFDDDGDIDVFFFHHEAWYAGTLGLADYKGGIQRLLGNSRWGGTEYGQAFRTVTKHFFEPSKKGLFGRKKAPVSSGEPVYVAFLTDGESQDEHDALRAAQESSDHPIFFQSIGIGNARYFSFIKDKLNNHGGRVDNFGFFSAEDLDKLSDVQLLDGLLNEFPAALDKMRAAGTLA